MTHFMVNGQSVCGSVVGGTSAHRKHVTCPGCKVTTRSRQLFLDLAQDAGNWSGTPLLGGNVPATKETRGNLTQLKRASLVTTQVDEDDRSCTWVIFTDAGKAYAKSLGVEV